MEIFTMKFSDKNISTSSKQDSRIQLIPKTEKI